MRGLGSREAFEGLREQYGGWGRRCALARDSIRPPGGNGLGGGEGGVRQAQDRIPWNPRASEWEVAR